MSDKAWSKGARISIAGAVWLLVSVLVIAGDRVSKWVVLDHFFHNERLTITPFFDLTLMFNTGAAFSFLADAGNWKHVFFTVISIVVCGALVWLLLRSKNKLFSLAAAMIIGGAIGNLWDRLQYGRVVDFLLFHYREWYYPAFNMADAAICVGAALLIIDGVRSKKWHDDESSSR